MIAELEYNVFVPLDKNMTEDKQHEFIKSYLQNPKLMATVP